MTDRREWPNAAKEGRDRCAELASDAVRELSVLIAEKRPMSETEKLRHLSEARSSLKSILIILVQMGAPVREV